jgi:hypothetical protein
MAGSESSIRTISNTVLLRQTGFTPTSGTAYFVFVGRTTIAAVWARARIAIGGTAGSGAQTAEIGLFSTPVAPNSANQTLTKLEATGTVDSLITINSVPANTTAFTGLVLAGTHLWIGLRTAMATTQPTLFAVQRDFGRGHVLTTAAAGALTASATFAGVVPAFTTLVVAQDCWASLD